jgi:hypothetical protein
MQNIGVTELVLILLVVLIVSVVKIIPYWKVFAKAGFSPWLSFLMIVPVADLVLLYYLGFSEWPALRGKGP